MATTSPDNLRTPDPGDPYNLVPDLATLSGDVQTALNKRSVTSGTVAQRTAFTTSATDGWLWQDTDGIKMIWRKDGAVWVPAVWRWSGSNTQMTGFAPPEGFEWFNTTDGATYLRVAGVWSASLDSEVVGIVASGGSLGANWSGQAAPNQPRIVREGNKRTLYGSIVGAVGASLTSMLTVAPADRPPTAGQRFIGIGFARSTTPTDSRAFSVTMTAGVIGYEAATGAGLTLTWPYRLDGLSWWMD